MNILIALPKKQSDSFQNPLQKLLHLREMCFRIVLIVLSFESISQTFTNKKGKHTLLALHFFRLDLQDGKITG